MSLTRFLKVSFTRVPLTAEIGGDIKIEADVSALKDAILGVTGAVGVENCLKLGAGALALCMAVKSIAKHCPWVKAIDVDETGVKVLVPAEKVKSFDDLVENRSVEKPVAADFKNLDKKLKEILPEEEYNKNGEEILKMLEGVRIGAITAGSKLETGNVTAAKVIHGEQDVKEDGVKSSVIVAGNDEASGGGTVAGMFVGKGGKVKSEIRGGSYVVMQGYDGKSAAEIAKNIHGSHIRIKILGDQLEEVFEQDFELGKTIYEVARELKRKEGKPKDEKVVLMQKKSGKEKVLDNAETLVEDLGNRGDTVVLWAKFPIND